MKKTLLLILLAGLGFSASSQAIRLATYQYDTLTRISNLQPLANYLEKKLGKQVEVKSYPDVPSFIAAIQQNKVDLGFINTFGYLLLTNSATAHPMQAVAAWVVPKETTDIYKSSFIVRKHSAIQWDQLSSRSSSIRLCLVAAGSTSGNLVPRLLLTSLNLDDPEKSFKSVSYAGTHQAAVEQVLQGKADLAAMGQDAFLSVIKSDPNKKAELSEIRISPEIPLGPALLNQQLSREINDLIVAALLELHTKSPEAMEKIRQGWTEARKATHFEQIASNHYEPFLQQFGKPNAVASILLRFAK
ncbi:phosphate/phosphite/phosphonate ABC transporter substrate-binding protein [Flavihumibacter sp. UBA7668]|uniref:phosphate/phosphite/phosphonate ABC transporter substrate-binding protein n=1 Tax=Flavihumibacter sp. UBA7668 TaxID=1946542 RepID=UPI0025C26B21|nr:phosphate/phosphite/phosphonate ABC transporter substrate-binding protein [Flavihumibacter sp. UBA7668]